MIWILLFAITMPTPRVVVKAQADPAPTYRLTLQWQRTDSRVVGYVVFYGLTNTASAQPVGMNTEAPVVNLAEDHYWFAVGGYDGDGLLCCKSQVLTVTLPPTPILDFCFDLDGDRTVLMSFTNRPPGTFGKFYTIERKEYRP